MGSSCNSPEVGAQGVTQFVGTQEFDSLVGRKASNICFSPSRIAFFGVSPCCDRRSQLTRGAFSFPIPQVSHLTGRVYRHIPCGRSARHATDLYRGTVVRSQTLWRADRSISTSYRLNSVAAQCPLMGQKCEMLGASRCSPLYRRQQTSSLGCSEVSVQHQQKPLRARSKRLSA
jgi:hypothetical protein